jgi:hypothetical protein
MVKLLDYVVNPFSVFIIIYLFTYLILGKYEKYKTFLKRLLLSLFIAIGITILIQLMFVMIGIFIYGPTPPIPSDF